MIPFKGLTEQQINLRISVINSGAVPVLKLRWVGEEVQREDIAQVFKTALQENSATTHRSPSVHSIRSKLEAQRHT